MVSPSKPPADEETFSHGGDRRRALRVDLRPDGLRVELVTLADFLELYALNISSTGMFIRSDKALPIGTRFQFRFDFLRDQEPLTGIGEVVWLREGPGGGLGIRFVELSPAARAMVATIVETQRHEVLK